MSSPILRQITLTAAALLSAGALAFAVDPTVTTDPVGFITLSVTGSAGAGATAVSFRGLGLARPVDYQGVATSVTANYITVTGAGWTANQFNDPANPYYAEITGPAGAAGIGTTYDVTATTATTITLGQNLATGVGSGTLPTFRLRKHWTLASVFGATNTAGLQGGRATTADQIQVFSNDGTTLTSNIYYYSTSAVSGIGWRRTSGSSADQANTILYPDDGLVITRKQTTTASVVLTGAVKTGQSSFPIFKGTNVVANPYAAPMTLLSSGLHGTDPAKSLAGGTDPATTDQVLIHNGTAYVGYYFNSTNGHWLLADQSNTNSQDAVSLPVGASFVVKRAATGTNFDLVLPQHPTTL